MEHKQDVTVGSEWRNRVDGRRIRITKIEGGAVYFEAVNGDKLAHAQIAENAFLNTYEEPR